MAAGKYSIIIITATLMSLSAGAATLRSDTLTAPTLRPAIVSARGGDDGDVLTRVISGPGLRAMSAYSVADALRFTSGAQIRDYGGIGGLKTIDIRSIGNQHTAVSYGGVTITNAQNGIVDLGRMSLQNVGLISVCKGFGGDLLRPAADYASASRVSIVPLRPTFGAKGYNLRASLQGGSFGTVSPEVTWEQRLSERLALQMNGALLSSDGRYSFRYRREGGYDTTATRRNGDIRVLRLESALYGSGGGWTWDTRMYLYASRRGLPGAVVRGHLSHVDRQKDLSTFAQATARRDRGRLALLLSGKLYYDYTHYLWDQRREGGALYVDNHYHQRGAYVSGAGRYRLTEHLSAALSADYTLSALNADLTDFVRPLRHTLMCAASARWERGALTAEASQVTTYIHNKARSGQSGSPATHTDFAPMAEITWRLPVLRSLSLHAFAKRTCRYPTFNDLYYTFIGNTRLRPEYASQYDAGLNWSLPAPRGILTRLSLSGDVYLNTVSDKIIAVPAANQFRWTMTNIGRARILGADMQAEAALRLGRAGITAVGTWSYCRAEDRTYPGSPYYGDQLPYMPRQSASLALTMAIGGWTAQASAQTNAHRYDSSASTEASYMPAYTLVDIAGGREISLGSTRLRLTAAVNNLLDRRYEVVRCYPMPGRNYKISLSITL